MRRLENWREQLVECAAEATEELMDKYLEGGELSEDEIRHGVRVRTLGNEIVPALCGSAFKNKGVQAMLDAVIDYMPAPTEVKAIDGVLDDGETHAIRESDDGEPFSALQGRDRPPSRHPDLLSRLFRGTSTAGDQCSTR